MTTPHVHYRREGRVRDSLIAALQHAQRTTAAVRMELRARELEATVYEDQVTWQHLEAAERAVAALHDLAVLLGIESGVRV